MDTLAAAQERLYCYHGQKLDVAINDQRTHMVNHVA
jgi:hypothetical protein